MSAIRAVDQPRLLIWMLGRILNLSHARILPWVFDCVEEVNILTRIIKATKLHISLLDRWIRKRCRENALAVVMPEGQIERRRACCEVGVPGHLVPSELGAVLVSPLPKVQIDIISDILQGNGIILSHREAFAEAVSG